MSELMSTQTQPKVEETNCKFSPFLKALRDSAISRLQIAETERNATSLVGSIVGNSDVPGYALYNLYLESFPTPELRQEHTCSCCEQFFHTWGNLVVLTKEGRSESALFVVSSDVPDLYRPFVEQAYVKLLDAKLTRVRYGDTAGWLNIGQRVKGEYEHFQFDLPYVRRQSLQLKNGYQEAAEVREDVGSLGRSLGRWPVALLKSALGILRGDARTSLTTLDNPVETYLDVVEMIASLRDQRLKHNYMVIVAITKGKGVTHITNTVTGQFLDYLKDHGVEQAYAAVSYLLTLTDPSKYMRPTVAPAAQNIVNAEKLVRQLGLKDALRRRAMRRDELVDFVWHRPEKAAEAATEGVFGAVVAKGETAPTSGGQVVINGGNISLNSLLTRKLSDAIKIEVWIPASSTMFASLTTAVVPEAPPILKCDRPDARWPVSAYRYIKPVHASLWGLKGNQWEEVLGVIPGSKSDHRLPLLDTLDVELVLVNGYDTCDSINLPLFPQLLIADLYPHRDVIEAFCKTAELEDAAQGLVMFTPYQIGTRIRITTEHGVTEYTISSME